MRPSLNIRPEAPSDLEAIRHVNQQAFARDGRLGTGEADLVDALRLNGKAILSLVAEVDGRVVGHVFFSPLTIESDGGTKTTSVALGPLGVLPEYQRRGVGSALVRAGLDACQALGHESVFLLGHTNYYPRFGFRPARLSGIIYEDGRDSFQVIELREGALEGISGTARFATEFDGV